MKPVRICILAALIVAFWATSSEAGWLIYHEPEFKGKILDIDTKQPIEGAVVVVEYKKEDMGMGAGSISSIINVRETLTDKEGNFRFPSYTTLISPFARQAKSIFIIFKPGYASFKLALKKYFTGEETQEREGPWQWSSELKFKLRGPGIVELPKLKTSEERGKARMSADIFDDKIKEKNLPLLYKMVEEERKHGF